MSRWSGLRTKVGRALAAPRPSGASRVELAAVHDGRTLDVLLRRDGEGPHVLVLTSGDDVVVEALEDVAAGSPTVRALVDTARMRPGTWSVAVRSGDAPAMPLVHRLEKRQDGPARAQDGPLSLLATRIARLAAGDAGAIELEIEDVRVEPVVVDVVATPEGVVLRLGGPVRDGDEVVARSDDAEAVALAPVTDGTARCELARLPVDLRGPVRWRLLLRRDGSERPMRFYVADLARAGAAIKFPALDLTEGARVVRRRPMIAGGVLTIDVRVQGSTS